MPVRLRVSRALLLCVGLLVPLVGAPDAARAERLLDLIPFGRAHRLEPRPAGRGQHLDDQDEDRRADPGADHPARAAPHAVLRLRLHRRCVGIIVTNRHVVEGALQVAVTLQNGSTLPARIIGTATIIDIALLKIDFDKPLPTVRWADSDKVRVGDQVFAIGNPLGVGRDRDLGHRQRAQPRHPDLAL